MSSFWPRWAPMRGELLEQTLQAKLACAIASSGLMARCREPEWKVCQVVRRAWALSPHADYRVIRYNSGKNDLNTLPAWAARLTCPASPIATFGLEHHRTAIEGESDIQLRTSLLQRRALRQSDRSLDPFRSSNALEDTWFPRTAIKTLGNNT